MPYSVQGKLVVAISSRALFDFEEENRVFERDGEEAYIVVQWQNGSFPSCIRGFDSLRPLQSSKGGSRDSAGV